MSRDPVGSGARKIAQRSNSALKRNSTSKAWVRSAGLATPGPNPLADAVSFC